MESLGQFWMDRMGIMNTGETRMFKIQILAPDVRSDCHFHQLVFVATFGMSVRERIEDFRITYLQHPFRADFADNFALNIDVLFSQG